MKRLLLFLPLVLIVCVAVSAKPHPATSCSAASPTGAKCSADCASGMALCWASATEVHCECRTGDPGGNGTGGGGRVWGPATGIGTQQMILCNDFAAYLRSSVIMSPRTSVLAADVDSTVAAVMAASQGRYAAACDAYVDHEMLLTQTERDSIAAWRDRNNPWAGKPTVGRYVSVAGSEVNLSAVVPNPFRESTTINYALPVGAPVRVAVYNSRGALVTTLEAGEQNAGQYVIRWNGTDELGYKVEAGMYLLQLTTPNVTRVQKMEVVR